MGRVHMRQEWSGQLWRLKDENPHGHRELRKAFQAKARYGGSLESNSRIENAKLWREGQRSERRTDDLESH